MKEIKDLIREARKAKKISQKQLADITGLSIGSIQGYEQGRFDPKHENLVKIADALGVTLPELAPERYGVKVLGDIGDGEKYYDLNELDGRQRDELIRNQIRRQGHDTGYLDGIVYQKHKSEAAVSSIPKEEQIQANIYRLTVNINQLNVTGIGKLADYSDDLVQSGKYKKEE